MNPFIDLAQDPVGTLSAAGYALLLLALVVVNATILLRWVADLYTQATLPVGRREGEWYDGPAGVGSIPPGGFVVKVVGVVALLAVDAFALGALAWLVGA